MSTTTSHRLIGSRWPSLLALVTLAVGVVLGAGIAPAAALDPAASVRISAVSVVEGTSDSALTFANVTISGVCPATYQRCDLLVGLIVDTAIDDVAVPPQGRGGIGPGPFSYTQQVAIVPDATPEANETSYLSAHLTADPPGTSTAHLVAVGLGTLTIVNDDPGTPAPATRVITAVSGGGQTSPVWVPFARPVVVRVTDAQGGPVAGATVTFFLDDPSFLARFDADAPWGAVDVLTGSDGTATSPSFSTAQSDVFGISAVVDGARRAAFFAETSVTDQLTLVSGNDQTATAGAAFPSPLVVRLTDPQGRPRSGVPVDFAVTGPATFAGGRSGASVATGADGTATAPALTAGTTAGAVSVTAIAMTADRPVSFRETVRAAPTGADLVATAAAASTSGATTVPAGTPFLVAVKATNRGPATAGSVLGAIQLPAGVSVVNPNGGVLSQGRLFFSTPSLAPGASVTFLASVRTTATTRGAVTFPTAVASWVTPDPNGANNTTTATVTIAAP